MTKEGDKQDSVAGEKSSTVDALVAKARTGEKEDVDRLFAACRNYLNLMARTEVEGWMKAKVDASDLVQQTLLDAHRDFHRFQGRTEAEWLGWLRRILSHNTGDFIRRFRSTGKRSVGKERPWRNDDSNGPPDREPVDPGGTPSAVLMSRESDSQVSDAVARLPDDYQEVVVLRCFQRLPFDEVALRMGRSRPAVQMLWMRAIRRLQEILQSS